MPNIKSNKKKAIIVVGCSLGDEGKGTVTDYLTDYYKSNLVIRYNGGAQCAHNVHVEDKHFCFKQLSSGSLAGASTLLLDTVIINPITLIREIREFRDTFGFVPTIYIHENALVTTPYHIYANRIEENVLNHGSCGMGIYKTVQYDEKHGGIRIKDLGRYGLYQKITKVIDNLRTDMSSVEYEKDENWKGLFVNDVPEELNLDTIFQFFYNLMTIVNDDDCKKLINDSNTVIFEGAQGVLLDKDRGFLPHVSATDTTATLAENFLKRINYDGEIIKLGILRSYLTRHGAGPFPSEDTNTKLIGENNTFNDWQKNFRIGRMDYNIINYGLEYCSVDQLFVTCLDNDPYEDDTAYLSRAYRVANDLKIPLFGYSFGRDRLSKKLIKNI
jgi:adenylosuccinate synthase